MPHEAVAAVLAVPAAAEAGGFELAEDVVEALDVNYLILEPEPLVAYVSSPLGEPLAGLWAVAGDELDRRLGLV